MLHKKYRPRKFADLRDQEENTIILKEILRKKSFGIPFLFTGPWGSGKTSASRVFAKAILCQNLGADFEPCDKCQSCLDFQEDKNPNYMEIDAASNGDVQSIRDLRESTGYAAIGASPYKITNIDEAHNITKQGYNALLKLLEEGSAHHIFIFCTNEPHKMLETVRSRCWRVHSLPISASSLSEHLKHVRAAENADGDALKADDDALELLAKVTAPHVRDALNTLDFLRYKGSVTKADIEQYFQLSDRNLFLELLIALKSDVPKAVHCLELLQEKFDADTIYTTVIDLALALHAKRKGVEYRNGYVDEALFNQAFELSCDYLAVASFLLKAKRPLDVYYLKYLLLQTNRLLNNESMLDYLEVPMHLPNNPSIKTADRGALDKSEPEVPKEPIIQGLHLPEDLADDGKPAKRLHPDLKKRGSTDRPTVVNYGSHASKAKVVPPKEDEKYYTTEQLRDFLLNNESSEKGFKR